MKKAFTLIEVLLIIGTLPIFMLVISHLFSTMMKETPRIWNNVQQNTTMLNMLSQLQSDIDKSQNLPQTHGDFTSNEKLLLIKQEDTLIGYEFDNGQVTRRILNDTQSNSDIERKWQIPDANIKWNVHTDNGNGYCLEITNYIEYKKYGRNEEKMMNSHLYFIGAM
ncbi:MAG: type II secretion system protein [Sedimentisphaerales bacterium]|nr:type II secretion system protein [Sedimentisphaerales bacterium]